MTRRTKSKDMLALALAVKRRGRTYSDKVRNPAYAKKGGEGTRSATQHVRDQIISQYHVEAAKHPSKSMKQMVTHLYRLFTTPPLEAPAAMSRRVLQRDGGGRLFQCSRKTVDRTLKRYLVDSKSTS